MLDDRFSHNVGVLMTSRGIFKNINHYKHTDIAINTYFKVSKVKRSNEYQTRFAL